MNFAGRTAPAGIFRRQRYSVPDRSGATGRNGVLLGGEMIRCVTEIAGSKSPRLTIPLWIARTMAFADERVSRLRGRFHKASFGLNVGELATAATEVLRRPVASPLAATRSN